MKETATRIQRLGEKMNTLKLIAAVLVITGGINWGLIALAHFDLVAALLGMNFGQTSTVSSIIYGLVGLSGLYQLIVLTGVRSRE